MSSVPGLLGLSPVDWAAEAFAFEFGRMSELGASGAHHFTEVRELLRNLPDLTCT